MRILPKVGIAVDPIHVFDIFCGCGGTSEGFRQAGLKIALGLDNDPDSASSYRKNFPEAAFVEQDIAVAPAEVLDGTVAACRPDLILFCGCAPCQPWSKQMNGHERVSKDHRAALLTHFGRQVARHRPEMVFVENVPGLQRPQTGEGPFRAFIELLRELDYRLQFDVVASQIYGVPQRRRRLILMASLLGPISFPRPTHGPGTPRAVSTVRKWISTLPPLAAGERHSRVADHEAAILSDLNLRRIRAVSEGGSRADWPTELQLDCHAGDHEGHTDVYGRMRWDVPAPGLTTRCVSLSNGRFGHPTQDRAISVREAACLQTFPRSFRLDGGRDSRARQIGNAVPVVMARAFARAFQRHARSHQQGA